MDYEDYDYGNNTVDDMMADYDYHINTSELIEPLMNLRVTTSSLTSTTEICLLKQDPL